MFEECLWVEVLIGGADDADGGADAGDDEEGAVATSLNSDLFMPYARERGKKRSERYLN